MVSIIPSAGRHRIPIPVAATASPPTSPSASPPTEKATPWEPKLGDGTPAPLAAILSVRKFFDFLTMRFDKRKPTGLRDGHDRYISTPNAGLQSAEIRTVIRRQYFVSQFRTKSRSVFPMSLMTLSNRRLARCKRYFGYSPLGVGLFRLGSSAVWIKNTAPEFPVSPCPQLHRPSASGTRWGRDHTGSLFNRLQ
jgi:hypothetical protein